ncbi:sigma-70 family RNA polymerase sigma factor, partial [Phormidesmis sp. 146-12]
MQPRQSVTDLFSAFLKWATDGVGGWTIDPRLHRSIRACLERVPEAKSESYWAIYWHKVWLEERNSKALLASQTVVSQTVVSQTAKLSEGHLSAYLQEACYWSAYKTIARLSHSQFGVADCFQVAIAEVPKILKACDPEQRASLKTYASTAFSNIIRDYLRQRREIDFCTDWGLLLKLSRKRLIESLENAGINSEVIENYTLAWTCFTSLYIPKKSPELRKSSPPDRDTWIAITNLYNSQTQRAKATPESLERWLTVCASRSRDYLYPSVTSLNLPKSGDMTGERQD